MHRVGVFGGSFDPPHLGHLICVRVAAEQLGLDLVLVVPAAQNPHKTHGHIAPAELRWEMTCALFGKDRLFKVDRCELDRPGPSYMVDTLEAVTRRYPPPKNEIYLVVGEDVWGEMSGWKNPERIRRLAKVAVMRRTGGESRGDEVADAVWVQTPVIDISSTWVRERVRAGLPVEAMVGCRVAEILKDRNPYGGGEG